MPTRHILTLATCLLVLGAGVAEAGRVRVRTRPAPGSVGFFFYPWGLYAGAGLAGTSVLHQSGGDDLLGRGGGVTVFGGLRISDNLALEAGWLGSLHEPRGETFRDDDVLTLNALTADARIYLPSSGDNLEPYLQGGLGVYLIGDSYVGTQSIGTGFQAGGGFDAAIGANLSLGLRLLYRGMAMGPPDTDETDTYIGAVTAEGNLTLRF
ncbi:outer membrane beta-barrel protein [Haliangium sp.]|uniref:outer membrane beta-barrel protein n=1 Tax=Haliangium sp. TaxID=2663208 RepID=UPI003D130C96